MNKYIIMGKSSQETTASMLNKPQNRRKITEPLLKTFKAENDESMVASTNLIYASGSFSSFNWFKAFEAEEMKGIYQLASDNMASYISAKQKSQEEWMYERNITFTLLAPSLWAVVKAIASNIKEDKYNRMLFKTGDNNGFIIEIFESITIAGKKSIL